MFWTHLWSLSVIITAFATGRSEHTGRICNRTINARPVHAFYYLWYGDPETDGRWLHWNHRVLPHWTEEVNIRFNYSIGKRFDPPYRLHSIFYPSIGPYSSRDAGVIKQHMHQMLAAGIGVAVLSWWGIPTRPGASDTQGVSTDQTLANLLNVAASLQEEGNLNQLKFAIHLEPYPGRSIDSVAEDIAYIHTSYVSQYPQLFATVDGKPLIYVYDSYHISPDEWSRMLLPSGSHSIRGSARDVFAIGLWLDREHGQDLAQSGFDGAYSYFASDGFSFGSTSVNWKHMTGFCRDLGLSCSLSVGPGYDDTKIRPWNGRSTRSRSGTQYYRSMFERAVAAGPDFISITSFNEWGEGTQIESAAAIGDIPAISGSAYPDDFAATTSADTDTSADSIVPESTDPAPQGYPYPAAFVDLTAELGSAFIVQIRHSPTEALLQAEL